MSIGLTVGGSEGIVKQALDLYRHYYWIARGAPQELKLLVDELRVLITSIGLLAAEAQDPESALSSGGEGRVRLVGEPLKCVQGTLKAIKKHAETYGKLGSSGPELEGAWARFQRSVGVSNLDLLRNQVQFFFMQIPRYYIMADFFL